MLIHEKICPNCRSKNTKKHSPQAGKQRYLCKDCAKSWTNKPRPRRLAVSIWQAFTFELHTVRQLSAKFNKSQRWIRYQLAAYQPPKLRHQPRPLVVILDATYFGRSFGVLVAMDAADGSVVYYGWLDRSERTSDYRTAVDTLESLGYVIQAAVIDGRRGVRQMLLEKGILTQHCQFHQLQTITQCLTRKPKLPANQELRAIALGLTRTDQVDFTEQLKYWHDRHSTWLRERYRDETGRLRYRHARTRRAYFSLIRNQDYLFTCHLHSKAIPNTTNRLDGQFGVWKMSLKRHRGCSKTLKTKMLRSFFSRTTEKPSN